MPTQEHTCILPLHIKLAGSGFHIPSSPHTEVILPSGRSPDRHLYTISEPNVVLVNGSTSTRMANEGVPQLTERVIKVAYLLHPHIILPCYSPIQLSSAGSGVQLPFDAHTAVTFPAGTNPGLHPNTISAPSVVF